VHGQCDALTGLARVALRDGRYGDVIKLAQEGVALADAAGDRAARARPLHLQAAGLRLSGDHSAARELYLESLALGRELNDRGGEAMELHNLGWVELHLGNVDEAERRFEELDMHATGDEYLAAWRRLNRAALVALGGDRHGAARMYGEAMKAIHELGVEPDPDDQYEIDWLNRIING
jgi:tetratricopeptide (TPR) repeat protein